MPLPGHQRNRVQKAPRPPLHECDECGSELVHPVDWEQTDREHWTVSLRCPNCQWTGSGTFEQALVDALDQQLDEGAEALMRDLAELATANMADAVDRFVQALWADAILPEDF